MKHIEYILSNDWARKEVDGPQSNQRILTIIKWALPWANDDSTTAWCAIYISWVLSKFGYNHKFTAARQFLQIGTPVTAPQIGDIVVFSRGNQSWQGHVGIFIRQDGKNIYTLGGNQANQVNITPYNADRLLGYRRLVW